MSDLHLEFTDYQPPTIPSIGEDVVILAGDIGAGIEGVRWATKAIADRPVLYVIGNHEYYRQEFIELPYRARAAAEGTNVHILENDSIVIGGIRFLGCTFWTDFRLFGSHRQQQCIDAALDINDYQLIEIGAPGEQRTLTPSVTCAANRTSRAWLDREISSSKEPCVVITHHGPSYQTCELKYRNDLLTASFLNNAENLMRAPVRAWVYGHTHQVLQIEVNQIPLLTNQRGYPEEETPGFSWDKCFEIHV